MLTDSVSSQLRDQIRAEIQAAGGWLSFERLMELALYAPGLGYYISGTKIFGAEGDFVTAPEISPLFGRCLAVQCAEVLAKLRGSDLLEFGAGSGSLAITILDELWRLDSLPERYLIIEPSPTLQALQQTRIKNSLPHNLAKRCVWPARLPSDLRAVVLANEVLDAFPVHRFQIGSDGKPYELGVSEENGQLIECARPVSSKILREVIADLWISDLATASGYTSEINLRIAPWLQKLANSLTTGFVLLIDYGYSRANYYQADRTQGTLLCHYKHQVREDLYFNLGLQDITAHVDFTTVAEAGLAARFHLIGFTTQANFLIGCGIEQMIQEQSIFEQISGAKQLLLPTEMGERFKVLGLSKSMPVQEWCGFTTRDLKYSLFLGLKKFKI